MLSKIAKKLRIDINKNSKLCFYLRGLWILYSPDFLYEKQLFKIYQNMKVSDKEYISERVDYYNKLNCQYFLYDAVTIKDFINKEKKKTYFFDLLEYLRYFSHDKNIVYIFGDVKKLCKQPSIVKSRPICENNNNSIIMKLNKVRHFIFINDQIRFEDKKNQLVWRGKIYPVQENRISFMQKFFESNMCDVGQINDTYSEWKKNKLSLKEQLEYKFILAIEGNDVASNLKWIMSSNSLAFMVKPKYETWFMEGRLIPDYHYVLLKDDYSDLEDKINYYSHNLDAAQKIIANANKYVEQFKNNVWEDVISIMVLKKYFAQSATKPADQLLENVQSIFFSASECLYCARNEIRRIEYAGMDVAIKSFKVPHYLNRLIYRYFRQSKARRSYENALRLEALGIGTPSPVGYKEVLRWGLLAESYYVSHYVLGSYELRRVLHGEPDMPGRKNVLHAFGQFASRLHEQGVLHHDLSPGNVLVCEVENGYAFYLVDTNRMRFSPLNEQERYKNFAMLWANDNDLRIIMEAYAIAIGAKVEMAYEKALRYSQEHKGRATRKRKIKQWLGK